jgi:hypothetical protein
MKFEIGEGSGTAAVFVLQGRYPKDAALPPGGKRLKKGGFIVTIPYPELAKYEEAMAGVPWVRAEECDIADDAATFFDYIMDAGAEVTVAADPITDEPVVIEDAPAEDPRRVELLGKSLVNLRKEAKGHGVDIKGMAKEGLIEAILSAEAEAQPESAPKPEKPTRRKAKAKAKAAEEPEPEPEPVKAPAKPKKGKGKAPAAETKAPAAVAYKDLQAQAAGLGYGPVVGKSRAQLEEWVAAGPAAGATEPTPKPEPARKKREPKGEAATRTSYEEQLEAAAKVLTDLRPLVAALKEAFGGSVHKTRIALSSIAAELDPDKRTAGNAMIGFPSGKTLKIAKSHKEFGPCVYTVKFKNDGRSMSLIGFEGEAHGRSIAIDTTGQFWLKNEPLAPEGLKQVGIVEAAKRGMEFPNFNQLMRLLTQRQYPRISWSTFIGAAEVSEV